MHAMRGARGNRRCDGAGRMLNIRVINRHLDRECVEGGRRVYVGRPGVLGNRYVIGRDGDRETVIRKFKAWLWDRLQKKDPDVVAEIERLYQIALELPLELSCSCMPASCHAEPIRDVLLAWPRLRIELGVAVGE